MTNEGMLSRCFRPITCSTCFGSMAILSASRSRRGEAANFRHEAKDKIGLPPWYDAPLTKQGGVARL